jgi:hypothetical protein
MAAPATCHLETLMLPKNESNTCWWLSANLALFHKPREEIRQYYESIHQSNMNPSSVTASNASPVTASPVTASNASTATASNASTATASNASTVTASTGSNQSDLFNRELSRNFIGVYEYYSGANSTVTLSNLTEWRLGSNMAEVFNTADFQVDSYGLQSSDEYISKLSGFLGFDKGLIPINPGESTSALDTFAYDIQLHANHFGKPVEGLPKFYSQLSSRVETLILTVGRLGKDAKTSIPIVPLSTITVPTFEISTFLAHSNDLDEFMQTHARSNAPDSNLNLIEMPYKSSNIAEYTTPSEFYLDAMVVYEPGHYVSYVKCETNDTWYYYKAMKEGTLADVAAGNISYSNFDALMLDKGKDISENLTHMIYSKVIGKM